tara:strand:+ start:4189 stop:4776 length:588 start_codon:yes stop_codon:yes gene_type:complete
MNAKKCSKCGIEKSLTEFHKNKGRKDGHRVYCKSCIKKISAQYYAIPENKEKIIERVTRYYAIPENKEKRVKTASECYTRKNAEQPNCTYKIKNLENNKAYIGETMRGELRWEEHLIRLRGNYHENKFLQEDFDKYGEKAFEWTILKEFESEDKDLLILEEVRAIQQCIQDGVELYNLVLNAKQLKMLEEDKKSQ